MPARMVAFDTESREGHEGDIGVQSYRVGCAVRWRTDLVSGDRCEAAVFDDCHALWTWVTDFCKPGTRTVAWAHNLGYDVRISKVFQVLPSLGWSLEWCNLDRNVSAMTWRSDRGTLVLADTWTWLPLPLNTIAPLTGTVKFQMPEEGASDEDWATYCMQDAEVVYRVVSSLVRFIKREHLGNWQPTGAGMAYTTWRHKFMPYKVLVHDDLDAIAAERSAMHTGRAEAWRHGKLGPGLWTEVDMRNAYLMIGAECELPRKLRGRYGQLSIAQFRGLADRMCVLGRCDIDTSMPVVPYRTDNRYLWPTGTFTTWLWDTEIDCALRYGAKVRIRDSYVYARDPVLRDWAEWILANLRSDHDADGTIAATWLKHCSRALIGRIAMRRMGWELFGSNPDKATGISFLTNPATGLTQRLMHVGDQTLIETQRTEGRHSLPQITGRIMAECRVRLWDAMNAAGLDHVAHVDTDSLLVDRVGLDNLRRALGARYETHWQAKGTYKSLEIFGPRSYIRGGSRVTAGIPVKAREVMPGVYFGEQWTSVARDLELREGAVVTTRPQTWTVRKSDPRRDDSPEGRTRTVARQVCAGSMSITSVSSASKAGS